MKEGKLKTFSAKVTAPKRVTISSAGYDLFSCESITISSRGTAILLTNIDMKFDCKLLVKICLPLVFQRSQ